MLHLTVYMVAEVSVGEGCEWGCSEVAGSWWWLVGVIIVGIMLL